MENMNKTDIINNKTNLLIITICCALICSIHLNIIRHYTRIAAYTTLTVSDDNFRAMQVECDLQDIINKAEQMNVNSAELFIVLCCTNGRTIRAAERASQQRDAAQLRAEHFL